MTRQQTSEKLRHIGATAPLAATLERAASAGTGGIDLSAHLGARDEPGWVMVADLAADPGLMGDVMARIGRAYGSENPAFTGTSLLRNLLWRVLTPTAAAFLTERRLPDLGAGNVALRYGEHGFNEDLAFIGPRFLATPDDPAAGHPDAVVVSFEDMLDVGVRFQVAETYLPALIPALRSLRARRGTKVLGRAAADVCAEAFIYVGRELGREDEGVEAAGRLLAGPPPLSAPLDYRVLEFPGGSEALRVRSTCCLYHKTGNGVCFTCPRKTDEERIQDLSDEMNASRGGEGP